MQPGQYTNAALRNLEFRAVEDGSEMFESTLQTAVGNFSSFRPMPSELELLGVTPLPENFSVLERPLGAWRGERGSRYAGTGGARIRDGLFWGGWITPVLGVCRY